MKAPKVRQGLSIPELRSPPGYSSPRRAAVATVFTACQGRDLRSAGVAPILLFSGRGTSPGDVAALENILSREHPGYSIIGTGQLNRLTELEIRQHRLLIIPGGNFEQIGKKLISAAAANIRGAVRSGLNYLGICAGAFFAGNSPYNGLNNKAKVTIRKSYGLRTYRILELALDHSLGKPPEPESTHDFF